MSHTRIARVMDSVAPMDQSRHGTFIAGRSMSSVSPHLLYLQSHRLIRNACHEERRPGLFVFALHTDVGLVGRLWLSATEAPRAGTLGRHHVVDLPITRDGALSLRHVLFVVRLVEGRVRFSSLDLETPGGVHTVLGPQHATESERPLLLRTAQLSFFCVPTGPACALPAMADDAWRAFDEVPPAPEVGRWAWLKKRPEPSVGVLTLRLASGVFAMPVEEAMAKRGVLIGRDERCEVVIPDNYVSRVHAVVLGIDGVPHLVDCGSSNGVWHRATNEQARCWRLVDGDVFHVGNATLDWHAVQ